MFTLMKQKKEILSQKFHRFFTGTEVMKITQLLVTAGISINAMAVPVLAAGQLDTIFGNLIALICKVFFYIGAILLAWAIGQLVLAFKNEDADSKSRAVMVLVCAIMLLSISTIYSVVTNGLDNRIEPGEIEI